MTGLQRQAIKRCEQERKERVIACTVAQLRRKNPTARPDILRRVAARMVERGQVGVKP